MKALVLGQGKSGKAAADALRRRGFSVDFADGYDLVVASPGVPVKSELPLGCEALKARGWRLLAVTGSKGKSSVVKLVADAINLAGGRAIPCGNYGRPVCDLIGEEPAGWAVVEVSSFQLETTSLASDTFEAAVVLNLQEDHLNRHGSLSVYHGLKKKLLGFAGGNPADAGFGKTLCAASEKNRGVLQSPASAGLIQGSYFDNEILCENGAAAVFLMRAAGLNDAAIRRAFLAFE